MIPDKIGDLTRVLVIENSVAITGAVNSIVRCANVLKGRFDFHFVLPTGSGASEFVRKEGHIVHEMKMRELHKSVLSVLLYTPSLLVNSIRLRRLIKRHHIGLIHSNDFYNLVPAVYRALGGSTGYICHVRFMPSRFPKAMLGLLLWFHRRYAARIVVVSGAVKSELPADLPLLVIPDFPPEEHNGNYGHEYNKESTSILYLSNYIRGKGQDYAVKAFSKIHSSFPRWKLRFVGGDMGQEKNKVFKQALQQMATERGVAESIEWKEFSQDIASEFRSSSFLINFSDSESFSMTCLEAMHFGLPVIATNSGGPTEIIETSVNGLLVPVGDVDQMASAIEQMISRTSMRSEMAEKARTSVRSRFDPEKLGERVAAAYLATLRKDKSVQGAL